MPLRLHRALLKRAAGRPGIAAVPAEKHVEPVGRLQDRGERRAGAGRRARQERGARPCAKGRRSASDDTTAGRCRYSRPHGYTGPSGKHDGTDPAESTSRGEEIRARGRSDDNRSRRSSRAGHDA